MATLTTAHGLPYPDGAERVRDGDNAIGALATQVDVRAMSFGLARRDASTLSAATGNIWLSDLVGWLAEGLTVGAGGITIPANGFYEAWAWGRQSSSAASTTFNVHLGIGNAIIATSYGFAATAGTNVSLATRYLSSFTAGQVIQLGYGQAAANTVTFHGGTLFNGLSVRRIA